MTTARSFPVFTFDNGSFDQSISPPRWAETEVAKPSDKGHRRPFRSNVGLIGRVGANAIANACSAVLSGLAPRVHDTILR